MAKKKKKTQNSKKNKTKNVQTKKTNINKVAPKKTKKSINNSNKSKGNSSIVSSEKEVKQSKKVVDKNHVKYNVLLEHNKVNKNEKNGQLVDKEKVEYNVVSKLYNNNNQVNKNNIKIFDYVMRKLDNIQLVKKQKKKIVKNQKKNKDLVPDKFIEKIIFKLRNNLHILFNSALIITYIILLTGLIRTNAFSKGSIIYISCIVIFLSLVAIGYNKYISGKIYSLMIIAGMLLSIYHMQYTYDFINNINSSQYEYKTYYVVTFNNGQNKSIYNINNKKVCLLKNNSTNIERKLNTKLDSVIYIEYNDPNKMYGDFYDSRCRAIIVNENQYKYLTNNIENVSKNIKILYEFEANGKK